MSLKSCFYLLGLALTLALSLPAQTVRVLIVSGTANLTPAGQTVSHAIVKGEAVTAGATISTGADGRVVLTPMPGVKSIITPNTSITLESISESKNPDSTTAYSAVLDIKVGAVVSDLNKPDNVTYDYSVRTPRGLAGARGTTFTVGVNAAGIATVVVSHGTISLTFSDGRTASITPGHISITKPDGTTVETEKVSDLSAEDQKIAANWTGITLEAVADAIESGVELAPETLKNVLNTADSLGVEPTPKTTTLIKVIQTKLESLEKAAPAKKDETTKNPVANIAPVASADTISGFRNNLTPVQQNAFDKLNTTNQQLLSKINDPVITTVVLRGDTVTGTSFTNTDLRINLTAISKLSPTALAFLKAANGSTFDRGPGPAEWSTNAFDRSAGSWNALSPADRTLLLDLRSTEVVMDRSATFVSALITQIKNDVTPSDLTALQQAGWGHILFDSYGNPYGSNQNDREDIIMTATALTPTQRDMLRYFDIDAYDASYRGASAIGMQLDSLAMLSSSQLTQLQQLDLGGDLLDYSVSAITNGLDRINALSASRRQAVVELELGYFYLQPGQQSVTLDNQMTTTVDARLIQILDTYLGLETKEREALRDARIFDSYDSYLGSDVFDPANLAQFAAQFALLPEGTQTLLLDGGNFSVYELINPNSESSYRNFADFTALAANFSAAEIQVLLDIRGADILARAFQNDPNALTKIRSAITFYQSLGILQKFTLSELQIINTDSYEWLTANQTGLRRLLSVYSNLSGDLRAGTTFLNYSSNYTTIDSPIVFLNYDYSIYNVSFTTSTSALHVGAIKDLVIEGNNGAPTFDTATGGALFLHASNLIDLDTVDFGTGIRSITMEAATINLANINFPDQSVIALNSLNGGIAFGSKGMGNGKVNFVANIRYNDNLIDNAQSFIDYGKNFHIGTLANPVKASDFNYQSVPAPVVSQ